MATAILPQIHTTASAELLQFRSRQIQERAEAEIAANVGGNADRFYLDSLIKAQDDEAAAFLANLESRAGKTQQRVTELQGAGSSLLDAINARIAFEQGAAQTGFITKDGKKVKVQNEQRAQYAESSARLANLGANLTPFLTYLESVGSGTATTAPDFASMEATAFAPTGGSVQLVTGPDGKKYPVFVPNQPRRNAQGVLYGSQGRAPNWWPGGLQVPSDVSFENPIPDRWEPWYRIDANGGPEYIGPRPPHDPTQLGGGVPPITFGQVHYVNPRGEWDIRTLPQYATGIASAPEGLSVVHAGELLINMRGGERVVPAAQVPQYLGQGGNTTYNDHRSYPFAPNYYGAPPAQQMDYALLKLLAQ